jgi:cytochrome P450
VLLLFGAANRDPARYSEPDRFLIERNPTDHLAFGAGIHYCLGAALARLEASVLLRLLAKRVAVARLEGEPQRTMNPSLRGFRYLPVELVPA